MKRVKAKTHTHINLFSPHPTAHPVMALCKSWARNDVVWDVGPSSYTTSYPSPSRGDMVFAGLYHRADTTELFLYVFVYFLFVF